MTASEGFYKGRNFCDFLFASLDDLTPKMGLLLKKRICILGSIFRIKRQNEDSVVASPESVSINLDFVYENIP